MRKLLLLTSLIALSACNNDTPVFIEDDNNIGSLPSTPPSPEHNPTTDEKVKLGKLLFWDPILSGNKDIACASCHHPNHGYAENLDLSIGVGGSGLFENRHGGKLIHRNAPTILNTAFNGMDEDGAVEPLNSPIFWDNRANSLEEQALLVLQSGVEMRGDTISENDIMQVLSERLLNIAEYRSLFNDAFGDETINAERITQAIAAFERSLIASNSPFDLYARGDENALTEQQIRGMDAFVQAGCAECHGGPMFSDFELHQLPVKENAKLVQLGVVDEGNEKRFRTPSLRNLSFTAPYMHNGTEATLRDAILFYDDIANPGNSKELANLNFDDVDSETLDAIEAFIHALSDDSFDKSIPQTVPSSLKPGGNI